MEQFECFFIRRIIGFQLPIAVSKVIAPLVKSGKFIQIFISTCRVER